MSLGKDIINNTIGSHSVFYGWGVKKKKKLTFTNNNGQYEVPEDIKVLFFDNWIQKGKLSYIVYWNISSFLCLHFDNYDLNLMKIKDPVSEISTFHFEMIKWWFKKKDLLIGLRK